ncbi:putative bifunctional diguanylate cyclase/phosphodiesterase [Aureimonas leprariae]|uniref:EAL domain-containing protein n=1 Tax=Plantimonas leprariae TaxID=2615207 RepID=A0A7V7PMF3_9HYPH|nr:EAL domain-containing protein [Aureimonas leprariae]KAB0678095.1 EAL domain-containing protein [Aureimonas leprariae]
MSHLLADLTSYHDPYWAILVLLAAVPGMTVMLNLLHGAHRSSGRRRAILLILGAIVSAAANWGAFLASLKSAYPQIEVAVPLGHTVAALATSFTCSLLAVRIAAIGRRSGRNVLLAGSLQSFGLSCMIFVSMSGMVSPFALSYDLTAVLVVMILGAMLSSFAIWENSNTSRRHPLIIAVALGVGSIAAVGFGSLAAVLSFGDWMDAVAQPDDLTSSPIVVIGAAEAATVLVLSLIGSLVDNRVAARDKLEANRLRQLADSTFEAILIHRNGVVLDGNEAFSMLLDVASGGTVGLDIRNLVPDEALAFAMPLAGSRRQECEIRVRGGERLPVEMLSRSITYRGEAAVVTALRDISERRASEARVRFLAHHDLLTELPNRVLLKERLDDAVAIATATDVPLAVLCLDLDGFKLVNDTFGHAIGDELLQQVAVRLRACLGPGEFVARIGGDEFVILQPSGAQSAAASDLAQRVIAALSAAFDLQGRRACIGTSIGVAVFPSDGDTPASLLKRADIALYRAKHGGRGCFRFFDAEIDHEVDDRPQLERELQSAIAGNELALAYQPIFDRDEKLLGFEALMRWTHPTLGPISPARFIPIAEESKLIVHMGEWALRKACRTAADWPLPLRIAVNLSPIQMLQKGLCSTVEAALNESGLPPEQLELEITEGVLLQDADAANSIIGQLRALGVRIVLDDFGTGYSSLSYLHRFQFQKLKIDRSFVQRLSDDRNAQAIVKAIISMSRDLGIAVTAEGVETAEQLQQLRLQGCDELQGYRLGRPLPHDETGAFVARYGTEAALAQLQTLRERMASEVEQRRLAN